MSLGQWSWRGGFAEIDCPLPISDLGHVLKVLANLVEMFIEFSAEHLDCVDRQPAREAEGYASMHRAQDGSGSFR